MFFPSENIQTVIVASALPADAQVASRVAADLGLSAQASNAVKVDFGAFRGSSVYLSSSRNSDTQAKDSFPTLVGVFLIQAPQGSGQAQSQTYAEVAIQVELGTCYLRNAQVVWKTAAPEFLGKIPVEERAERSLKPIDQKLNPSLSPLRLSFRGGDLKSSVSTLRNAQVLGEAFAAAKQSEIPLRSELLAQACAFFGSKLKVSKEQSDKLRVHRDLVSTFVPEPLKAKVERAPLFPLGNPQCAFRSAPFSHKAEVFEPESKNESQGYSPLHCFDSLLAQIQEKGSGSSKKLVQSLSENEFEVTFRNGRHVTLSSGRTAGLFVGSRLVGPKGEKLHVIRLLRSAQELDSAIAYVRSENEETPIKPGVKLSLDPRLFPAKGSSAGAK
jgi:hypothetical protein